MSIWHSRMEVVRTRNVALALEMEDDEEMDGLHAGMFRVRMDRAWPHATTPTTPDVVDDDGRGADLPTAEQDPVDGTEQLGPRSCTRSAPTCRSTTTS